jgi:hypothetical protein
MTRTLHASARPALAACTALVLLGCASQATTSSTAPTVNKAYPTQSAKMTGEIRCPISGEVVTTSSPCAMYGVYPVYCKTVEDARQFAALPKAKRAQLATEQVLAQKRITNTTCPLTGEKLTAAAAPVLYDGMIIGFASVADANQFNSLPPAKKKSCIDAWKSTGEKTTVAGA